jgi:Ser/Thr protein kinase RdoA (MazF antagonist)
LWRAFHEVKHSYAVDVPQNENQAFEGAKGFACFAKALADLPPESLHDSIPHFHNGQHRLHQYRIVLNEANANQSDRVLAAKMEILSLKRKVPMINKMHTVVSTLLVPKRVTHNDTKINNILFDQNTNQARCVIDLDTVMAGTWLYDFGDMVRTFTSTASEDEPDPKNIHVDASKLNAVREGFLSELSDQMSEAEKALMPLGAQYMCTLIGLRFLTDFLQGDTYFPVAYPEHNLVRARNQFLLADELQKHYPHTM